jgi:hypothetical protein
MVMGWTAALSQAHSAPALWNHFPRYYSPGL